MFNIMFTLVFVLMFVMIITMIVTTIGRSAATRKKNNDSPRLTVDATVVAKRMDVSNYRHGGAGDVSGAHGYHTTSTTSYYVTFEVSSGDRMELELNGSDSGLLIEGDKGRLTFQGTRYLGFERA